MAITEIWNITADTARTLEYVSQDLKSKDKTLVFSGHCSVDWKTANLQMRVHRQRFNKDSKNLLYHGCVSFKKDELSPEHALEYAKEWMQEKFDGYQYFASVHVDTDKIHFNFTINAVGLDGKKYNDCNRTLAELRAWTDTLCEKNGLSVVIPKDKGVSYKEWMEKKNGLSWKEMIRKDIDEVIAQVDSFEEFLSRMKADGYFIKRGENLKHIVFVKEGMKKGARGATLGANYTEEAIRARIRLKEFSPTCLAESVVLWKNGRRLSPLQKELRRLKGYRQPTVGTTLALAVHLLFGTIREDEDRRSVKPRKRQSVHDKKIKELCKQLSFIRQNDIKSRVDIKKKIAMLHQELFGVTAMLHGEKELTSASSTMEQEKKVAELSQRAIGIKKTILEYEKLTETLDEILQRQLWRPDLSKTAEQAAEVSGGMKKEKGTREV